MSVHPDDKCLFHYTTFDSLQKILQSRVVRASDVRYQNDSSEYMYSVDLLANHVAELPMSLLLSMKRLLAGARSANRSPCVDFRSLNCTNS